MRIQGFTYLIKEHLHPYELRNTTVVVDGQNVFYTLYNNSGLPLLLGSECDKFAQYVRKYLGMFKRNNLKCLFVVKGGHENGHLLKVHYETPLVDGKSSILDGPNKGKPIQPVLAKDIFLEILKEMDFDFTICDTNDVIKICFDLACRLSCPVVSFNIQYSFGPAPYIPLPQGAQIEPCIFEREHFLKTYKITLEKMILFIILTDINIFDENLFLDFFTSAMIPFLPHTRRYKDLLKWLSRRNLDDALHIISKYISEANKKKIVDVTEELKEKFLTCNEEESAALLYFTDKSRLEFTPQDPLWFQKGVALKYIAIPYINTYRWGHVCASRLVEDYDQENTIILSTDIIKYAFDLLKNFNGQNISIIYRSSDVKPKLLDLNSLSKPEYKAVNCVFENGWSNIDSRKLFEHFFIEKLDSFNFDALEDAPEDAKLLIIAMVYFTRNKEMDVEDQMCSTMLSYVLLGVIADKIATDEGTAKITFSNSDRASRPLLDNITDKDLVTTEDCNIAKHILGVYQHVEETELQAIFNRKKVHPLLQFERCLQEINYLNQLCGSPYAPTRYSKTYSATFVYKFIDELDSEDAVQSIRNILSPAATVLAFTTGMIEIYKKILYGY